MRAYCALWMIAVVASSLTACGVDISQVTPAMPDCEGPIGPGAPGELPPECDLEEGEPMIITVSHNLSRQYPFAIRIKPQSAFVYANSISAKLMWRAT
jgi:hypothetical protein